MDSPRSTSPIKDPKRIDIEDPAELDAWCTLLKLSAADLRTAVGLIGPMSAAVAVYVNSRGRRGVFRQVGEIGHPFDRKESPPTPESERGDATPNKAVSAQAGASNK